MATVEVHYNVQQMHFQLLPHTGDRRTCANVGDAIKRLVAQSSHFYRIYPFNRGDLTTQRYIRRRETDSAAQRIAMNHTTRNGKRMPQQVFCGLQLIIRQCLANRCTADANAAFAKCHRAGDVKTVLQASLL